MVVRRLAILFNPLAPVYLKRSAHYGFLVALPALFGLDAYQPFESRVEPLKSVRACSVALLPTPGDLTLKPGADSLVVDAGLVGELFERRPWRMLTVGHLGA